MKPAPAALVANQTAPSARNAAPSVLLFGNPNVGKTTLFNALTGENARVGNYPGITVERRTADLQLPTLRAELVDAPGCYSLSARSFEEQVAISSALGLEGNPAPDLIVLVVDAGQLTRNLYLALQLAEFRLPIVLALTMLDEVDGPAPIPGKVGALFGVPCVAVNPRDRLGLPELRLAIEQALGTSPVADASVVYPAAVRALGDRAAESLPSSWRRNVEHDRALALWALLSVSAQDELHLDAGLRERVLELRHHATQQNVDIDLEIIAARYQFIEERIADCYSAPTAAAATPSVDWTERIDSWLLHPVFGLLGFLLLMLVLFQSLFTWTGPAVDVLDAGVAGAQEIAQSVLGSGFFGDLVVQGILGGVGNVIVFLPQILLLFLFVGLLEDSGYMARVAYLMDRVLRGVGLHGKAFVPMLSGMACAVPAILSTRTMERQRDRILTMMVVPLMTCSARLPVYSLVIGALFPPSDLFGLVPVQGLLMVGMYVFAIVMTLIAAAVLGRTVVKGHRVPLLLELPRYRWPSWPTTLRAVWQRGREFLTEAGTVILGFTILMWVLLSYPKPPQVAAEDAKTATAQVSSSASLLPTTNTADASQPAERTPAEPLPAIEYSFGGQLGKALEPVMRPLGFDWKLTVGVIGAFSAREVFVSVLGLVFGLEETDDEALPLRERMRSETRANGEATYPPLVGLSLLVFFALACQCMSTLAVVRRETRTWSWPALLFVYMTGLAYVASFIVYQTGVWLGFAG